MFETLRDWAEEVAPRRDHAVLRPDTDLGFGGYGMTVIEYLVLLHRIERHHGVRFAAPWPRTLAEIADRTEAW